MYNKTVERIVRVMTEEFKKDPFIDKVYLFGSQAKSSSKMQSDIDFAIISANPSQVNRRKLKWYN